MLPDEPVKRAEPIASRCQPDNLFHWQELLWEEFPFLCLDFFFISSRSQFHSFQGPNLSAPTFHTIGSFHSLIITREVLTLALSMFTAL